MNVRVSVFFRQVSFQKNYDGYIIFTFLGNSKIKPKNFKFLIKNFVPIRSFEIAIQGIDDAGFEYDFGSFLASKMTFVASSVKPSPNELWIDDLDDNLHFLEDVTFHFDIEKEIEKGKSGKEEEMEKFFVERRIGIARMILRVLASTHFSLCKCFEKEPELKNDITQITRDFNVPLGKIPEEKIIKWFE
ncbi:MAG: hypothetical protein WCW87_03620 [Candidatus Paceibacterota bacterium]